MARKKQASSLNALPEEILLEIVRACIEPYSLKILQGRYTAPEVKRHLKRKVRAEESDLTTNGQRLKTEDNEGMNVASQERNSTLTYPTNSISLDTVPKTVYWADLPKVTNLQLVNKMFHNEIQTELLEKFENKFIIEFPECLTSTVRSNGWTMNRMSFGLEEIPLFRLLRSRTTIVELFYTSRPPDLLMLEQIPNLETVMLDVTEDTKRYYLQDETNLLTGQRDTEIIDAIYDKDWKGPEGYLRHMLSKNFCARPLKVVFKAKFRICPWKRYDRQTWEHQYTFAIDYRYPGWKDSVVMERRFERIPIKT